MSSVDKKDSEVVTERRQFHHFSWTPAKVILGMVLAGMIVVLGGMTWMRVTTGRGPGILSFGRAVLSGIQAVIHRNEVRGLSQGKYTNIVFLHHSTGEHLIQQGGMRALLGQAGYGLWDQGYNQQGLYDPQGRPTGYGYNVPGDNTDPDGLARIFNQTVYAWPVNTFSALLQHEVIIVKSCFAPASHITSDEQLLQYQAWYLEMRTVIDRHPDKLFIILTQPPLNPAETTPEAAVRARQLADWLVSDEYVQGRLNLVTFDLFDRLAERDLTSAEVHMLRTDYRNGTDSHPNQKANETIGPVLVDFILQAIQRYRAVQAVRS